MAYENGCDVRGLSPSRDRGPEAAFLVQFRPRDVTQRRALVHAGYASPAPACPVLVVASAFPPSPATSAPVHVPSSSPARVWRIFPSPSPFGRPADLEEPRHVRVGEEVCLGPWMPLLAVGGPALLDKRPGHDRGEIHIRGRAAGRDPSPEPSHVEGQSLACLVPVLVRERQPCRALVRALDPTREDVPGIGPVPGVGVGLVCVDASGEVDVCGPYHVVGVREEAGASNLVRSEAACGHVEADRRPCDGLSLEMIAALAQTFAGEEVLGQVVHERAETFYACGVRVREGKGSVYHGREPKDDHVRKGWGDHEEMRGTAHGEMQANVHAERGGPSPSLVLCRKDHGPWLRDGWNPYLLVGVHDHVGPIPFLYLSRV